MSARDCGNDLEPIDAKEVVRSQTSPVAPQGVVGVHRKGRPLIGDDENHHYLIMRERVARHAFAEHSHFISRMATGTLDVRGWPGAKRGCGLGRSTSRSNSAKLAVAIGLAFWIHCVKPNE